MGDFLRCPNLKQLQIRNHLIPYDHTVMDEDTCDQMWKKKKINDLPNSLEKLTIDQNKKCDKLMCKCSSLLPQSCSSSTSYSVKKCTHFKHAHTNPLVNLNKKYKKDLSCTSSSVISTTAQGHMNKKRSLLHSPKLKLRKTEPTLPVTGVDCASIGGGKKIFGTNSQMYPNLESFSSSSRSDNGLDVDARYQENCFKEARLSQPILCVAPEQPPLLPDTILHNISSISLQEPSCSFPSEPSVSSSPCDKLPATTNSQSCSIQARACYDDTSMSELASYFDVYCHIPKKMSHMAEMMYT
ncbi:hypothetical protein M8J75_002985 [Diaphorina citri]|nr:hypothetical protein M8J75_002985 [Diaphorina citri]